MSQEPSKRVLLMEDDEGLARLLERKLKGSGYRVDVARDGEEGLAKASEVQYDIVAVDHHMPVYDGLEVIRILGETGHMPPTIMVTGTGNEQIAVEAMKMGARDYVVKDPDGGYLGLVPSIIERVLEQERLIGENRRGEEQLQRSKKYESLALMAGGIAHDFNNLLQAIISYAEFGVGCLDSNPAKARDCLEGIMKGAKRGAELSCRMLEYTGSRMTCPLPQDLSRLVRAQAQEARELLSAEIALNLDLADHLQNVCLDSAQLRQVLLSLVTNSAEAMTQGGGQITLRTSELEVTRELLQSDFSGNQLSPGPYVILEVADSGAGMDEPTLQKIFDPFFTTKFLGRGLGLSMVFGIVRQHQGAILATSTPGQGTTVRILLPAHNPDTQAARPAN